MKWLKKRRQKPMIGSIRHKMKFAIVPVNDKHGVTVWLERFRVKQEYGRIFVMTPERPGYTSLDWRTVEVEHICSFGSITRTCTYCGKDISLGPRPLNNPQGR